MSSLLDRAIEKVGSLPLDEQDAIATQILDVLSDEELWKQRFRAKRDVIRRMACEAVDEDAKGETLPLDQLL